MISSPRPNARVIAIALVALLAAALSAGCATREQSTDSFLGFITPYRIEIVQGNAITREQAALVKPGMTRAQVRDILGSPMLTDLFHTDRWDYMFTMRRQGTEPQRRSVVARFDGDVLLRLEAPDDLPTEAEFVAAIVPAQRATRSTPAGVDRGAAQRAPVPPKKDPPVVEPVGAVRAYPPLEPR